MAHEDKIVKFVKVFPRKSGNQRNVGDLVQPNQDEYSKNRPSQDDSRLPMPNDLQENADDYEDNEVEITVINDEQDEIEDEDKH